MSVRAFVKHLHHPKNTSDLLTIAVAHKLELNTTDTDGSTAEQHLLAWNAFNAKREQFEQGRSRTNSGSRRRDSSGSDSQRKMTSPRGSSSIAGGGATVMSDVARSVLQQAPPKVVITPLRVNTSLSISSPTHTPMSTPATPSSASTSAVRHSSRARKRKQLHPMESYVYTSPTSSEPDGKRRRSSSIGDA